MDMNPSNVSSLVRATRAHNLGITWVFDPKIMKEIQVIPIAMIRVEPLGIRDTT
jgi:hypothetical protein